MAHCFTTFWRFYNGAINRMPKWLYQGLSQTLRCDSQFPVVGTGSGPGKPPTGSWALLCAQTVHWKPSGCRPCCTHKQPSLEIQNWMKWHTKHKLNCLLEEMMWLIQETHTTRKRCFTYFGYMRGLACTCIFRGDGWTRTVFVESQNTETTGN